MTTETLNKFREVVSFEQSYQILMGYVYLRIIIFMSPILTGAEGLYYSLITCIRYKFFVNTVNQENLALPRKFSEFSVGTKLNMLI